MAVHPFLIQAFYYAVVMVMSIGGIAVFMRGYFWNYFRVRLSFGRLVMVKRRSKIRDFFNVGWVEDGCLVFKEKKRKFTIPLTEKDCFYRCQAVNWIDIDEETNAISKTDYKGVSSYDAQKFSDLLTRALMRPSINSNQEKIILFLSVVILLMVGGCIYLGYMNYGLTDHLARTIPSQLAQIKGTIVGGPTI